MSKGVDELFTIWHCLLSVPTAAYMSGYPELGLKCLRQACPTFDSIGAFSEKFAASENLGETPLRTENLLEDTAGLRRPP